MDHKNESPLGRYNSLLDENLNDYFGNEPIRKHLLKSGLVNKEGYLTDKNTYRLQKLLKERRMQIKAFQADRIVEETTQMERIHEHQVQKEMTRLYKVELVKRRHSERQQKTTRDLIKFLSQKTKKETEDSDKQVTKLPDIHDNKTVKKSGRNTKAEQRQKSPSRKAIKPHPPTAKKRRQNSGGCNEFSSELKMRYFGLPLNKSPSEIQVIQTIGLKTVSVFRDSLPNNTEFTFTLKRTVASKLVFTISINRAINVRFNSCCDFKFKPGGKIGGKNSQFHLLSVKRRVLCSRCEQNADADNIKDTTKDTSSSEEENISHEKSKNQKSTRDDISKNCTDTNVNNNKGENKEGEHIENTDGEKLEQENEEEESEEQVCEHQDEKEEEKNVTNEGSEEIERENTVSENTEEEIQQYKDNIESEEKEEQETEEENKEEEQDSYGTKAIDDSDNNRSSSNNSESENIDSPSESENSVLDSPSESEKSVLDSPSGDDTSDDTSESDDENKDTSSVADSWIDLQLSNVTLSQEQSDELRDAIRNGGIENLKEILDKAENVKTLNLQSTMIDAENIKYLSEVILEGKHPITTLSLNGNPLGDKGIAILLVAMKDNKTIKNLDVGGCSVTDEGAEELAKYLQENETVTELALSTNAFTSVGWQHIAKALKINCTLKTLSIDSNNISKDGVKFLCIGIKENKSLVSFDVEGNSLDDDAGELLCEAIKYCETMIDVTLMPDNKFSEKMLSKIRKCIYERVAKHINNTL